MDPVLKVKKRKVNTKGIGSVYRILKWWPDTIASVLAQQTNNYAVD